MTQPTHKYYIIGFDFIYTDDWQHPTLKANKILAKSNSFNISINLWMKHQKVKHNYDQISIWSPVEEVKRPYTKIKTIRKTRIKIPAILEGYDQSKGGIQWISL